MVLVSVLRTLDAPSLFPGYPAQPNGARPFRQGQWRVHAPHADVFHSRVKAENGYLLIDTSYLYRISDIW